MKLFQVFNVRLGHLLLGGLVPNVRKPLGANGAILGGDPLPRPRIRRSSRAEPIRPDGRGSVRDAKEDLDGAEVLVGHGANRAPQFAILGCHNSGALCFLLGRRR